MAELRTATQSDVEAFTAHRLAVFREVHAIDDSVAAEIASLTREAFAAQVGGPSTVVWLATAGDDVVGSASLHAFERFPSPTNPRSREGYVSHVYVAPTWRRRGVGSALVRAVLGSARDRGLRRVRLHATEPGRALYESLGFRMRNNDMDILL